jgi:hypothetical protein
VPNLWFGSPADGREEHPPRRDNGHQLTMEIFEVSEPNATTLAVEAVAAWQAGASRDQLAAS